MKLKQKRKPIKRSKRGHQGPPAREFTQKDIDLLFETFGQGQTIETYAKKLGVHSSSVYRWVNTDVGFAKAFARAEELKKAWYIEQGRQNLGNRFFNARLYEYLTGNLFGWTTRIDQRVEKIDVRIQASVSEIRRMLAESTPRDKAIEAEIIKEIPDKT